MTRSEIQRLEAWMKEITDLLCYQPEVPMAHKTALVDALNLFLKEVEYQKRKATNERTS